MRSLLHQTTLAITAVFVLISCVTQTQAVDGELEGRDNPNSYGRQYMNGIAAASNGRLQLEWLGGGRSDLSFATVKYNNNQLGFMKCTKEADEKAAFTRLELARENLKGINVEYRNYVALPVRSVPVPESESPSKQAGNCFVYRYINGVKLEEYNEDKDYADQLISMNRVMPQILKGSIYLYNAGIIHEDLSSANVMVYGQTPEQLTASIIDFDMIGLLPPNKPRIEANIVPKGINPGSLGDYFCNSFNMAPLNFIPGDVLQGIVTNPQMNIDQIRGMIAQRIQKIDGVLPSSQVKLRKAIDAFISLRQVATILSSSIDCASLLVALSLVYGLN